MYIILISQNFMETKTMNYLFMVIFFATTLVCSSFSLNLQNQLKNYDQFSQQIENEHANLKRLQNDAQQQNIYFKGSSNSNQNSVGSNDHTLRILQEDNIIKYRQRQYDITQIQMQSSKVSSLQFDPQSTYIISKFQAFVNNNNTMIKFIGYDKILRQKVLTMNIDLSGRWNISAISNDGSCVAIFNQDSTSYQTLLVNRQKSVLEQMNLNAIGSYAIAKVGINCTGFAFNNIQSSLIGQNIQSDKVYLLKDGQYLEIASPRASALSFDNTFTYIAVRSFLYKYNTNSMNFQLLINIELLQKNLIIKNENRVVIKTQNKTLQANGVNHFTKIMIFKEELDNLTLIRQDKYQFNGNLKISRKLDLLIFFPQNQIKQRYFVKIDYNQATTQQIPYPQNNLQYSIVFINIGSRFFFTVSLGFSQYNLQLYEFNGNEFVLFRQQILDIPLEISSFITRGEIIQKQSSLIISLLGQNFSTGSRLIEFQTEISQQDNIRLIIIIVSTIGGTIIIIVIFVIVCQCYKKFSKKPELQRQDNQGTDIQLQKNDNLGETNVQNQRRNQNC